METSNSSSESSSSSSRSNTDTPLQSPEHAPDTSQNDISVSFDANVRIKAADQSQPVKAVQETVTVKFITQTGKSFTKAFNLNDDISIIKQQLANLFHLTREQVQVGRCETIFDDDIVLASLGVEALGAIELDVKTSTPFTFDRDLIYGNIPTMDVITVTNVHGIELVVEIEHPRGEKEWLGGYRHRITKKTYHHACVQTEKDEPETLKISRNLQTDEFKDSSTNTPVAKGVQTSWLPSLEDRIISPSRSLKPPEIPAVQDTPLVDTHNSVDYTINSDAKPIKQGQSKSSPQAVYNEIMMWNHTANNKLKDSNEPTRRIQRIEIFDRTRKFLLRAEHEKRKLGRLRNREQNLLMLSNAATPKTFTCKTGERVSMETVMSQRFSQLNILYDDYKNAVPPHARMKAIVLLRNFFSYSRDYQFADDITQLLQCELNLLTKGLAATSGLKERVEQFVFYFVKQHTFRACVTNTHLPCTVDLTPYRCILMNLQNDETSKFKCFTSVCFQMGALEIHYLVSQIWQNKSIKSECNSLQQLRMTRWLIAEEWSPCNCILLTKYEVKDHLKTDIAQYDKCLQSKVRNNHLRAQLHFCDILPVVLE